MWGTHCPKVSHSCITSSVFLAEYVSEIVQNVDLDATDNTDIISCGKCWTKPSREVAHPGLLIQRNDSNEKRFQSWRSNGRLMCQLLIFVHHAAHMRRESELTCPLILCDTSSLDNLCVLQEWKGTTCVVHQVWSDNDVVSHTGHCLVVLVVCWWIGRIYSGKSGSSLAFMGSYACWH